MKKILLIMFLICSVFTIKAETYMYTATSYQQKYSYQSSFSNRVSCEVGITIDTSLGYIKMDTERLQYYIIKSSYGPYRDSDGDRVLKLSCTDEEGLNCTVRIISGTYREQLYVDYNNITWVYNLK
jgi:hypothetical protein